MSVAKHKRTQATKVVITPAKEARAASLPAKTTGDPGAATEKSSSLQSGQNPINSTARQTVHSSCLTNAARNKGRPLKAVAERLERERQEKLRIQQTENPSARRSSRLAAKSNGQTISFLRGGKMLCLASCHDCIEKKTDLD